MKFKNIQNPILFQHISEDAMMGFVCFDLTNRNCIYVNKLGQNILELGLDFNFKNLKIDQLLPETSGRKEFRPLTQDMLGHEGLYQAVLVKKINDHTFIANVGVKKLLLGSDEHILLMIQDTTLQNKLQREVDEKQAAIRSAYEEVLEQNEKLKELDKAKSRFISLTTHELRTPLSAMVATSEVLKLGLYDNDEQLKEFIETIYSQGLHLMDLINDVLDFSKIQAGRMDYYIERKNLLQLTKSLVETHQKIADKDEIQIHLKIDDSIEPEQYMCYFDELRIKQVITNILSNAIKYNKVQGQIFVNIEIHEDNHILYVEDTGKGIPEESISKVFDEFETLGKVALHHEGTGLGMPISKQLMEAMGGKINLKSELNKGTTFWISIPNKKVLDEENYKERPDALGDLAA